MPVFARSFDYDGCLANIKYEEQLSSRQDDIIKANEAFFSEIASNPLEMITKTYTLNGSSRQSMSLDSFNQSANNNGSCFDAIIKVNQHLNAIFLPLLLADVDGGLPIGTSFENAMKSKHSAIDGEKNQVIVHAEHLYDESKVRLLYVQMHYIASLNPHDEIIFEFYDDRVDILNDLVEFYSKDEGRLLIPCNVTLKLNCYDGETTTVSNLLCQHMASIAGRGVLDKHYAETSQTMVFLAAAIQKVSVEHLIAGYDAVNVAKFVYATDILNCENDCDSLDSNSPDDANSNEIERGYSNFGFFYEQHAVTTNGADTNSEASLQSAVSYNC